jgi:DNA-binding transcriptional LysR family regulator
MDIIFEYRAITMEWDDTTARRLSTRELRIFLAVAHSGSMAKAAKSLATSQPAISKAVADMERSLGIRLLDRSPQGVEPTQYGQALIKCGIAVFNELKQGINEIEFLADPTMGELRIGCTDPIGAGLARVVMDELLQKHPRVTFHLVTTSLYGELHERNVELVVTRMPKAATDKAAPEENIDAEILFDDPVVVVAGPDNPLTRRRKLQLADLSGEPWVMPRPDSPLWQPVIDAFQAARLSPPRATVTVSSFHVRCSLIANGRLLSVVPRSLLSFQGKQGMLRALPVKLLATQTPIAIMTLKNRTLSPLARLFIERMRTLAKTIAH